MRPPIRILLVFCVASAALLAARSAVAGAEPPRVAVVADGASDRFDEATRVLATEVQALLEARFEGYAFPETPTHRADFTEAGARQRVTEVLANPEVDVVVGLGFFTGKAIAEAGDLPHPVLLPFAAPSLQGLPNAGGKSGQKNLTYLTGLLDFRRELERFGEVIQRDRVAFLLDEYVAAALPQPDQLLERLAAGALKPKLVPASTTATAILESLPQQTQAVYLGPLVRLPDTEVAPLLEGLAARGLPSYARRGRDWVERGALASLVPPDDLQRRMRRVALSLLDAWRGEDLSESSTAFESRTELSINLGVARRIGVYPSFALLTEAVLVGDTADEPAGQALTIGQAVDLALQANLDLAAARMGPTVASGALDEARAGFLPSAGAQADFTWLAPEAASPLGNAERQLSWGASARQLIYSPRVRANIGSRELALRASNQDLQTQALDLTRDVSVAFLDVLRASTAEAVNRENLRRTRQNLALAEVRVEVGSAGRQDVFRWQAQIADDRTKVIAASATRNQAEIALNRLLNRPLEAPLSITAPSASGSDDILDPRLRPFVADPWSFKVFRAFLAREALANAPELQALAARRASQSRTLEGERERLWVPDVYLSGGVSHVVHRSGEGTEPLTLPPPIEPGAFERADFVWQVGASLRFDLFDAARYARIGQLRAGVQQISLRERSLMQGVEQRVRNALHRVGASGAAVRLRGEAAQAAASNLELVTDAYRQGTVTVITLIDAQNQSLLTELAAANARFDFLVDLLQAQRAAARFGFLEPEAARDDFYRRLIDFSRQFSTRQVP